jgi:signal transduction histidine kinase/ActR/RegA family two-component response regulator
VGPPYRSIRRNLLLIVLLAVLPMGIFAGVLLVSFWKTQEDQRNEEQIARVRTIAALIESELEISIKVLQVLANEASLNQQSLIAFYERSKALLARHDAWANLALLTPDMLVMNASTEFGAPLPRTRQPFMREAFETGRPTVSDIYTSSTGGLPRVAIAVPVIRNDVPVYVLLVALKHDYLSEALKKVVPEEGVAGVFDRNLRFVARARDPELWLGRAPGERLREAILSGREGVIRSETREGEPTFTAWTYLNNGWSVGVATPSAPLDAALASHFLLLGTLWLGMLIVGLFLARLLWTRIDHNLSNSVRAATQLAAGRPVEFPKTEFAEIASLSRAIRDLFNRERQARTEALAASKAKDEFLAMLGHELRNPLAPIQTALYLLRQRTRDSYARELGIIERQLKHMIRLVDDLLDVARITRGGIKLNKTAVELSSVVAEAIETVSPMLEQKRIELATRIAPEGLEVHGDPDRLRQILSNLLSNSAKFTADEGRISIETARRGKEISVTVNDDGAGIGPDVLPSIFDLFVQGRQNVERPYGGLGLGLAIARSLTLLHGGELTAASEGPGKGSTFTLVLPSLREPGAAEPKAQQNPALEVSANGRAILIVDDNVDAATTLADLLGDWGYSTRLAHDGPSALRLLHEEAVEIALLDIGLPVMDGYQLAEQIRKEPQWQGMCLIALTGYGQESDRLKARESGFDEHLVKPVDLDLLAQVLHASVPAVPPNERAS